MWTNVLVSFKIKNFSFFSNIKHCDAESAAWRRDQAIGLLVAAKNLYIRDSIEIFRLKFLQCDNFLGKPNNGDFDFNPAKITWVAEKKVFFVEYIYAAKTCFGLFTLCYLVTVIQPHSRRNYRYWNFSGGLLLVSTLFWAFWNVSLIFAFTFACQYILN